MDPFASNMIRMHGDRGKTWLEALPRRVDCLSLRLGLRALRELPELTENYVLGGFQGKNRIVLKLSMDVGSLAQETRALECFNGYGAAGVLAKGDGWLLLEQISGVSLTSYLPHRKEQSIEIACKVMKTLHRAPIPKMHPFYPIKDWLGILDGNWEVPQGYLQRARKLRDRLLKSTGPEVLLHGDLHHDNILQRGGDWMIIDPKGVVGSPIHEVWAYVRDLDQDIPRIAHYFGFNVQNLYDCYFIHGMVALCGSLQNQRDGTLFLRLSERAWRFTSCV